MQNVISNEENMIDGISEKKNHMSLLTRSGARKMIKFDANTKLKYGVNFMQRINTPRGFATVIGECEGNLWLWVDEDDGVSYWDFIQGDVFKIDGFEPSNNKAYPQPLLDSMQNIFFSLEYAFKESDEEELCLFILKNYNVFTPDIYKSLKEHKERAHVEAILFTIYSARNLHLTTEIFNSLLLDQSISNVNNLIILLKDMGLLNQNILEDIILDHKITTSQEVFERYFLKDIIKIKDDHSIEDIVKRFVEIEKFALFQTAKENRLLSERFINYIKEFQKIDLREPNKFFTAYADYILDTFQKPHKLLKRFSDIQLTNLMNSAINQPKLATHMAASFARLKRIDLSIGGNSDDSWSKVTKILASRIPEVKEHELSELCKTLINQINEPVSLTDLDLDAKLKEGWKILRLQGRTILFQNESGDILAVKIQKYSELPEELIKEYKTTSYFKEHCNELNLEGSLPSPLSLNKVPYVLNWLKPKIDKNSYKKFKAMVGVKHSYVAYVYQVDKDHTDYFTYLHDCSLSHEEFKKSNHISITNLCKLFLQGVTYPQLADLFHNTSTYGRSDRGRYRVLLNLLEDDKSGTGMAGMWKKAVEFPNVRGPKTGLADWGDWDPQNDLMQDGKITNKYYSDIQRRVGKNVGNYLIASVLSEYQYVLFLIAGRRGDGLTEKINCGESIDVTSIGYDLDYNLGLSDMTRDSEKIYLTATSMGLQYEVIGLEGELKRNMIGWNELPADFPRNLSDIIQAKEKFLPILLEHTSKAGHTRDIKYLIWRKLAQQVFDNCVQAIATLTTISKEVAEQFLSSMVSVDRLTQQMKLFMTDEYAHLQGNVPDEIYGSDVKVSRGYDRDPMNLGAENGQEPIKEANKLFYWMNNVIYTAYHEYRLMHDDFAKIIKEKDPVKAELFESEAFSYLPPKKFHAAHLVLTKRKLQEERPLDEKVKLVKKAIDHKRQYAAATIQSFWKNKRVKLNLEKKTVNKRPAESEPEKDTGNIKKIKT